MDLLTFILKIEISWDNTYVARGLVPSKISPVPCIPTFRRLWNSSEMSPNDRGLHWGLEDFFVVPKRTPKNRGLFRDVPEVPRPIGDSHVSPFLYIKKKVQKKLKF